MKKMLGLTVVVALIAAPSFAAKVTIDYAHDFDFSTVKTFTYVDTGDSNASNQLTDGRIKNSIIEHLKSSGLQQVDSGGDLSVTYHVTTKDQTVLNTTSYGYGGRGAGWGGYGRGRAGGGYYGGVGMGSATTTASSYTEGTLIVDAYEPGEDNMVWRGIGTITVKDDPEKQGKQVDKIMSKLGKKWEKILKGQV